MKSLSALICLLLVAFSLSISPIVSGLEKAADNDTTKSGYPGESVTYFYEAVNDNDYTVDLKAVIEDETWDVIVIPSSLDDVEPGQRVTFQIIVYIPIDPIEDYSLSKVSFWEKVSLYTIDDISPIKNQEYSRETVPTFTTSLKIEDIEFTPSSFASNNPYFIGILIFSSLSFGYIWYGRKYFFLAPLYMNIPKEKLLDNANRDRISQYLSQYNGSNLSEISQGTGINIQTLRHHMRLFEQSNIVLKKEKRFFIRKNGSEIFDTEILSPVLQRVFEVIRDGNGITVSELVNATNRSKPWIGNRLHDLLTFNLIEIHKLGRYKYIYPKGQSPDPIFNYSQETSRTIVG